MNETQKDVLTFATRFMHRYIVYIAVGLILCSQFHLLRLQEPK